MKIILESLALLWVLCQTLVLGLFLSKVGIPATWEWFLVPSPTYFIIACVLAFFLILLIIGIFSSVVGWAHKVVEAKRKKRLDKMINEFSEHNQDLPK